MSYNYLASFKKIKSLTAVKTQGGFSLIELLVSLSIMTIVLSVVFARQNSFNGAVILRNQAYELALQIREIQLNAVSVSGENGVFRSVLGVFLDSDPTKNGYYSIFKDADDDGYYDAGEEYGIQGFLDKRFEIREIRAGGVVKNDLAIVFARPNFDAHFMSASGVELDVASVEIDVAVRGLTGVGPSVLRTVEITSTGQIAVK